MDKHLFKFRLLASYIMVVAWTMSGPILKTYFNLLPSTFFGVVGIWALVISLLQKPLRSRFSVEQLLVLTIIVDILFIGGVAIINYFRDVKMLLIYDMVLDGPYMAVLIATDGKLQSYYLGRFKPYYQDSLRSSIMNKVTYAKLIGLVIGSILPFIMDVYGVVWCKIILMVVAVGFELKALRIFWSLASFFFIYI